MRRRTRSFTVNAAGSPGRRDAETALPGGGFTSQTEGPLCWAPGRPAGMCQAPSAATRQAEAGAPRPPARPGPHERSPRRPVSSSLVGYRHSGGTGRRARRRHRAGPRPPGGPFQAVRVPRQRAQHPPLLLTPSFPSSLGVQVILLRGELARAAPTPAARQNSRATRRKHQARLQTPTRPQSLSTDLARDGPGRLFLGRLPLPPGPWGWPLPAPRPPYPHVYTLFSARESGGFCKKQLTGPPCPHTPPWLATQRTVVSCAPAAPGHHSAARTWPTHPHSCTGCPLRPHFAWPSFPPVPEHRSQLLQTHADGPRWCQRASLPPAASLGATCHPVTWEGFLVL